MYNTPTKQAAAAAAALEATGGISAVCRAAGEACAVDYSCRAEESRGICPVVPLPPHHSPKVGALVWLGETWHQAPTAQGRAAGVLRQGWQAGAWREAESRHVRWAAGYCLRRHAGGLASRAEASRQAASRQAGRQAGRRRGSPHHMHHRLSIRGLAVAAHAHHRGGLSGAAIVGGRVLWEEGGGVEEAYIRSLVQANVFAARCRQRRRRLRQRCRQPRCLGGASRGASTPGEHIMSSHLLLRHPARTSRCPRHSGAPQRAPRASTHSEDS